MLIFNKHSTLSRAAAAMLSILHLQSCNAQCTITWVNPEDEYLGWWKPGNTGSLNLDSLEISNDCGLNLSISYELAVGYDL